MAATAEEGLGWIIMVSCGVVGMTACGCPLGAKGRETAVVERLCDHDKVREAEVYRQDGDSWDKASPY